MIRLKIVPFNLLIFLSVFFLQCGKETSFPEKFDPKRNAANDIKLAVESAQGSNKRILLDVGGEWCIWCHRLDAFINSHKDLKNLITENFIWLKINYSEENKNEALLSRYPEIPGYPHFFVLDTDGKLLHSQDTGKLEEGKDYSKEKLMAFFKGWSAKK
jgi:thioredoxin-related protein